MSKTDKVKSSWFLKIFVTLMMVTSAEYLSGQNHYQALETRLNSMIPDIPALDEKINISVTDVTIQEFISIISNNANINIFIDPSLNYRITGNYNQVRVIDILLFLCKEYNLNITETGSIVSVTAYIEPVAEKPITPKKTPRIEYSIENDLITIDLMNDSLYVIVRKLTDVTRKNVIIAPDLEKMLISGYIKNIGFDAALEKLAYTNKLSVTKTDDNFYILEKVDIKKDATNRPLFTADQKSKKSTAIKDLEIIFHSSTNFSVKTEHIPLAKLVQSISDTLGLSYSIIDDLEGNIEVNLVNTNYEEFLNRIFIDGVFGFQAIKGFYIIGRNENPMLKSAKVLKLQHRTVEKIMEIIPEDVTGKLLVKEFPEQNSLIVVGNPFQIQKFETFINQVDQVVPLILIELLIVEVNKTRSVTTGLSAGIKKSNVAGNKDVSPGVDYSLSTATINNVLEKMNSFGWVNFGKVSPDFYLNIKALEEDGKIIIRSTPKLATLNGHEASLSSGETKFYKEERSNIIGTQNPTLSNSYTWTAIKADLSVTIKPIVSGNEQITLDITVDQSQFTPREYENSPPGSVTRNFKSLIRMKNQEMVLLGGLDKFSTNNTSKGIPLISRIPVLKWIFGSNTRSKSDTKLNLFIQPTIIY